MSIFDGLVPDIRDVDAPPGSLNELLLALPAQRPYVHDVKGRVLHLPLNGLVVVPYRQHRGGWDVIVVDGHGNYPRGGHDISVSDLELQTAIEVTPVRRYAVLVSTASGATWEIPAGTEPEAHEVASLNRGEDHAVQVIENVSFEPAATRSIPTPEKTA